MPLFLLLLSAASILPAEDLTAKGFDHFYNLEFDQSLAVFSAIAAREPNNPQAHNHVAQAILYREMLRSGALESELVTGNNPFLRRPKMTPSKEDQQLLERSIEKAIALTQATLQKSPNDVAALYAQGVAYGFRGNYNFLVRKAWLEALKDITASRKLHNRITELQPDFIDARLVQGVHDYVVGSLPFHYKILGFVAGFRGDRETGIRTLLRVAAEGKDNKNDAKLILATIYRRERRPADAIPLLKELIQAYPRNYLFRLEMVQMYADEGDKQKALETLAALDRLKQSHAESLAAMPEEKIHFSRGNLLFWYRDYDIAIAELRKAAAKANDLDLNTASTAFLRLGQCYDMKQQRNLALEAYRSAVNIAPDSDAARQSKQYLSAPYKRGKT